MATYLDWHLLQLLITLPKPNFVNKFPINHPLPVNQLYSAFTFGTDHNTVTDCALRWPPCFSLAPVAESALLSSQSTTCVLKSQEPERSSHLLLRCPGIPVFIYQEWTTGLLESPCIWRSNPVCLCILLDLTRELLQGCTLLTVSFFESAVASVNK